MRNEVFIRPAHVSDADGVAGVFLGSRQAFVQHAPLVHTEEDVRCWIKEILIPGKRVTLAIVDGEIVGMCAVSEENAAGWIDQLYVSPGYTGKGIGTALLDEAIPHLRLPVRLYTFQESSRARHFYEQYGFKAVKFTDGAQNEEKVPDVLYELKARRIIMENLEETVRGFLERYGQALGASDLPAVAACWEVPAMVLSDQGARSVLEIAEVEQFFAGAVEWYRSQGLVATRPQLLHVQALGQRLVSTDARWSTLNAAGLEVASETSRYILSLDDDGQPRIRVAITITA